MEKIIGVMGPSNTSDEVLKNAYEVGKLVALSDTVLLTGGMGGVMEEASRGAHEAGGMVLAICPTDDKNDLNQYVDIPVVTGMKSGRNYMNILSSDIVIAFGGVSAGTLSEIAYAVGLKRPIIFIGASDAMKGHLSEFDIETFFFAESLKEVSNILQELVSKI